MNNIRKFVDLAFDVKDREPQLTTAIFRLARALETCLEQRNKMQTRDNSQEIATLDGEIQKILDGKYDAFKV